MSKPINTPEELYNWLWELEDWHPELKEHDLMVIDKVMRVILGEQMVAAKEAFDRCQKNGKTNDQI